MEVDFDSLDSIDDALKEILAYTEIRVGLGLVVTSMYRAGDRGVHGTYPLRGIDVRCHDAVIGARIEALVNEKWAYDPDRPAMQVCWFHDAGHGPHLHFQAHPNTRYR